MIRELFKKYETGENRSKVEAAAATTQEDDARDDAGGDAKVNWRGIFFRCMAYVDTVLYYSLPRAYVK